MSGVHYLHSKHIVHRDLKLVGSIMLSLFISVIGRDERQRKNERGVPSPRDIVVVLSLFLSLSSSLP